MLDLIVKNAQLLDQIKSQDIAVKDGRIVEVQESICADSHKVIDAEHQLLTTPFVDSHFHMDSTLSYGLPRVNESGTLLEGIALWGELRPTLTGDEIRQRALDLCQWSIARGTLAIRTHVDISDASLLAVDVLKDVQVQMRPWLDLQLVAFPQDGYLRNPNAQQNLLRALDKGVEVIGGIPHFERTARDGYESVVQLCEIAADKGLMVDMHCDESDDPNSRFIEELAKQTHRLKMQDRVCGSHLTSMHSMDNYFVSKLIALIKESGVHAIANPLINITLQGRHDTYPKRRGMTRVQEMLATGINVAFGHDCVMDPWYSLGSHDMLEVAHMGLHVEQMTGQAQMRDCFDAITHNGARVMQLTSYGLTPGCHADFIILQCKSMVDALRLRPARLYVIRRGKIISKTQPQIAHITLDDTNTRVDFLR